MLFRKYKPGYPLSQLVDDLWIYDGYTARHQRERIVPSGTFEMVFNLRDDELRIYDPTHPEQCRRFTGSVVSGPYSTCFMSDTLEEASIMGVHFRPGGALPFLGRPAGELGDTHVDLQAIWGRVAGELREQLCAARTAPQRFRLLERLLKRLLAGRLAGRPTHHGAVDIALRLIMTTRGRMRVRDIAKAVDLSERRLTDIFRNEVGLTPKVFNRIQRFQAALALARETPRPAWAELAIACGYFDQSHLIQDFVQFSGCTPADYVRQQNVLDGAGLHTKRNHLPVV
jgi:AraC-like DNA-binding protein